VRTNVRVGVNVLVQHCLPPLYQPPGVIGLGLPRLRTSAHLWGASACHTGATKQVGQLGGAHHSPIPLELCPYLLCLRAQRQRVRCFRDSAAPLNKRSPRTSPAKTSRRMAQLIRCFSECRYKRSARAECCGVMTILGCQHRVSSHSWRWPRDGLAVCDLEMELHSTCTSEVLPCKPHRALQAMLVWGRAQHEEASRLQERLHSAACWLRGDGCPCGRPSCSLLRRSPASPRHRTGPPRMRGTTRCGGSTPWRTCQRRCVHSSAFQQPPRPTPRGLTALWHQSGGAATAPVPAGPRRQPAAAAAAALQPVRRHGELHGAPGGLDLCQRVSPPRFEGATRLCRPSCGTRGAAGRAGA